MARRTRAQRFMDELMSEPVRLCGCPQIVVTRAWAYNWYINRLGMDPRARGFGSAEHMTFGSMHNAPGEELSDVDGYYAPFLAGVAASITGGA